MACSVTGANARLYFAFQDDLTTPATTGFVQLPFIACALSGQDQTADDPVLGYGRSPQRPTRNAFQVSGRVTVPLDQAAVGYWLKLLMGTATVTGGADPYTHVWTDGAAELPAGTIVIHHADAQAPGLWRVYSGVMAGSANWRWGDSGRPRLEIDLTAVDEDVVTTNPAGTPTVVSPQWFHGRQATIKKDGSALARVLSVSLTYGNSLEGLTDVGSGGKVSCMVVGMSTLAGELTARFNDASLYDLARNETLFDLELGLVAGATRQLLVEMEQAELTRKGQPVNGAGRVEQTFGLVGSKDFAEGGRALKVTLVNGQATY